MLVYHYNPLNDPRHIIIKAAEMLGYKYRNDFNPDKLLGFSNVQGTKPFLIPAKLRQNVHVIRHAHVTKIILNDLNDAIGVHLKAFRETRVHSKKEIVISAGVISTPQLLMLSGIGLGKHLQHFDITLKQDLSEGRNIQDHLIVPISPRFDKGTSKSESIIIDYLDHGA